MRTFCFVETDECIVLKIWIEEASSFQEDCTISLISSWHSLGHKWMLAPKSVLYCQNPSKAKVNADHSQES